MMAMNDRCEYDRYGVSRIREDWTNREYTEISQHWCQMKKGSHHATKATSSSIYDNLEEKNRLINNLSETCESS